MLPKKDGFEVCRELRRAGIRTPILLLTAKSQEAEKVMGLDLGADDYVTKPFSPKELRARIRALLRRGAAGEEGERYCFNDVEVDFARGELRRGGEPLEVTPLEFKLLVAFVKNRGRVLSRDRLLDLVWGAGTYVTQRVVDNYIVNMSLHEPVLMAPDDGALKLVKPAAEQFDLPYDYLEKTRLSGDQVTIAPKNLDIKGRDVVLMDDIVSTGGTISEAIKLLHAQGAREVHVACIHAVLVRNALLRMNNGGMRSMLSTDTLEKATSKVSVAPIIAEAVKK
jgi:hypothetical protein